MSSSRAARTCSSPIDSIPSYATSSTVTREPKATVARIAIFAAASAPETSSRRDRPRRTRATAPRASAASYGSPPSMRVRMKFVVPFTIPSTRWTFVTTSASRSTLITGIAAQTLASKRSWTPFAEAISNSSRALPRDELLVRRDDRLARAQELLDPRPRRLEPAHHLGDDGDRVVVADRGEVGRQHAVGRREGALPLRVADERAHEPEPVPGRALDVVAALVEQAVDRGADRPVAEQRYRDVDRAHGGGT